MRVIPTEGPRPVVYGEHVQAPGAPTALIYGAPARWRRLCMATSALLLTLRT